MPDPSRGAISSRSGSGFMATGTRSILVSKAIRRHTSIAELHRRLPATRVLLLSVLPSERSEWTTQTTVTINNALTAKYAHDPAIAFVDVTSVFMQDGRLNRELFLDPKLVPPDPPLHPTAQGQALMSAAMEPVLAGLLGDRPHQ
jgi:lysophospholipase L1-like esterase